MRIFSKFTDFYDRCGLTDRTVCYVREEFEETIKLPIQRDFYLNDTGYVGFCGKLYPYLKKEYVYGEDREVMRFFSAEAYLESEYYQKKRYKPSKENVMNFFLEGSKTDDTVFIENKSPLFVVTNYFYNGGSYFYKAKFNTCLKNYDFQKIMHGQQAFQEIQMYITNQLVQRKDPDAVEEKYRLAQRGFDKYSFRHPIKLKDLK